MRLVTREAWVKNGRPAGQLPRTNDTFAWPQGPGVMVLDYDPPKDGRDPLGRLALCEALTTVVPGLAAADRVWWASASSHITDTRSGEDLTGLRGQRLYLLVADARDIPRAGAALVEHLWAAGHGHIEVSKSGALLERTLIDASMWQASRLDFAGGAVCVPPLEQRRGKPIIIRGEPGGVLDTRAAIPDPTSAVQAQAEAARVAAKTAIRGEAHAVREAWIDARAKEIAGPGATDLSEAAATARRAVENGVLAGDYRLTVLIDDKPTDMAVMALLDDPVRYHGLLTLDPIDRDYDGGRAVGKLFLIGARPRLYSFAHGGTTYHLLRQTTGIELVEGHTNDAVNTTLDVLRHAADVFDFGGQLVLVDDGQVYPMEMDWLIHYLAGVTQYWHLRQVGKNTVAVDVDPPQKVARAVLALGQVRRLKRLEAVITVPTLRVDGSVVDRPGYDEASGLLVDADEVIGVPVTPTPDQVREALERLLHPFSGFPVCGPLDRAVLLAGILTAAVRPSLPTAPAFGFDAPVQASGKTLLAACLGLLTTGRAPTVWPHTASRDDEETRKRLFTALRTGARALIWDNVVGVFDSAALAAALTAPSVTDRVLGRSEAITVPNRALVLMTGNNMVLAGDLSRRVLTCRIDPQTDRPYARQFDLDPLAYCAAHREELIAAALTLIRGRLSSGDPWAPGRMASFEAWDGFVRQTVAWLAVSDNRFVDPMLAVNEAQARDPEQEALGHLLAAWERHFGERGVTTREVFKLVTGSTYDDDAREIAEALIELGGERSVKSAKSIGRILSFRRERVVGGLRLTGNVVGRDKVMEWRLRPTKPTMRGLAGSTGFVPLPYARPPESLSCEIKGGGTNPPNHPKPAIEGTTVVDL